MQQPTDDPKHLRASTPDVPPSPDEDDADDDDDDDEDDDDVDGDDDEDPTEGFEEDVDEPASEE